MIGKISSCEQGQHSRLQELWLAVLESFKLGGV